MISGDALRGPTCQVKPEHVSRPLNATVGTSLQANLHVLALTWGRMVEWAHESLCGFGIARADLKYDHRQRITAVLFSLSGRRIEPDDVWVRWKVGPTRRRAGKTPGV